jgi:Histidine kinase
MNGSAAAAPVIRNPWESVGVYLRGFNVRLHPFAIIWCATTALALVTANECRSITHLSSLLYGVLLWDWWGVVTCVLWKVGEHKPFLSGLALKSVGLHAGAAALLGWFHLVALWSLGFTGLGWYAGLSRHLAWRSLVNLNRLGVEILIYGFAFGIVGVIQYQIRSQREAMRALELQRQLSAAQLRALQMQLEPHFLFNTLNAITTLVEFGRQAEATEMLSHLNAILKSTLKRTTPEKIPLSQELEIVESYLAIEQVRFADRLRVEIKVDAGALDSLVPCFLLQPIVENAIRHGIAQCENEGLVVASAQCDGNRLWLKVSNTGSVSADSSRPGNGIGLKNTWERLAHFYQNRFEMNAAPLEEGGFQVAIAIPHEHR